MAPGARLSIWTRAWSGRASLIGLVLLLSSHPLAAESRIDRVRVDATQEDAGVKSVMLDIPSQALDVALKAFGVATQVALFYETGVVSGRRSFPVHGEYPVDAALRVMLKGTGLSSTSFDRGTITILAPALHAVASDVKRAKAGLAEFSLYLALVQQGLDRAFCRAPVAASDPDDFLARVWISPTGDVQRAELLPGTGIEARDRVYIAALTGLLIGAPPPAAMPQPVNLMIMPKQSQGSSACMMQGQGTDSRSAAHE